MILPKDFGIVDIRTSYITNQQKENKMLQKENDSTDSEDSDIQKNKSRSWFSQHLIIDHKSKFWAYWSFLNILCCTYSSYEYLWKVVFYSEANDGEFEYYRLLLLEFFFLISMVLNFFVDYIPDSENQPVREIEVISLRYF